MDSLTQIVLGAAVGEATLGKKVGNKAMLWGAIAGTIPDLDVLGRSFLDDITALEWHRGISHSLFFSLVAAPVLGWLLHQFHKKRKNEATTKQWSWLFFYGLGNASVVGLPYHLGNAVPLAIRFTHRLQQHQRGGPNVYLAVFNVGFNGVVY